MKRSDWSVLRTYVINIFIPHYITLRTYVIGQKCGLNRDITHTFCFRKLLHVQNHACLGGISLETIASRGLGARHNSLVPNSPLALPRDN